MSVAAFGAPVAVLLGLLIIWGAAIIADSAQFSAAATELARRQFVGSTLTLQTALGFLLTVASIRLVPQITEITGWQFGLVVLALGPAAGIAAMVRLRRLPDAVRMAGGKR